MVEEFNGGDAGGMSGEGAEFVSGGDIPKLEGLVAASGEDVFAVGGEDGGLDPIEVSGESLELFSEEDVPCFEGGVATAGEGGSSIGGEGEARDGFIVGAEGQDGDGA